MANPRRSLPIPPQASKDPQAREMIRAWIAQRGLHCSVNIGTWQAAHPIDEPSAWGIMLADVVRHVSNALEEEFGIDRRESLGRIRKSLNIELDHPTSEVKGKFVRSKG